MQPLPWEVAQEIVFALGAAVWGWDFIRSVDEYKTGLDGLEQEYKKTLRSMGSSTVRCDLDFYFSVLAKVSL